jgi:hypothetical protein
MMATVGGVIVRHLRKRRAERGEQRDGADPENRSIHEETSSSIDGCIQVSSNAITISYRNASFMPATKVRGAPA